MNRCLPGFLALVLVGCAKPPEVVPVEGVVLLNGQPLPHAEVQFVPMTPGLGAEYVATGVTDENGRFTLEYDPQTKGAQVGTHTVSAKFQPRTPDEEMGKVKPHPSVKPVTEKYGDAAKSPMKVEITRSTDNLELKFD